MATETSNIDDLLMSGKTATQPETPEHQYEDDLGMPDHGQPTEVDYGQSEEVNSEKNPQTDQNQYEDEPEGDEGEALQSPEMDEYGNEKAKPRMYTEDEKNDAVNKAIRDRLARMKTQEQALPSVQQVQQAQDFEYNPDAEGNWQQQLETFVERTFNKINQRQVTQAQQQREQAAQADFQEKFTTGMERFNDFREVVGNQPITDFMTQALRGMKDPTAFVYAASKRHSAELSRISQIPDPYAQIVEMGKLEERMRKGAQATKAPRPVQRTKEDAGLPQSKKKQEGESIEDLIAKADVKRRAQLTARRGRG